MMYHDLEKAKHYYVKGLLTDEELDKAQLIFDAKTRLQQAQKDQLYVRLDGIYNWLCKEKASTTDGLFALELENILQDIDATLET